MALRSAYSKTFNGGPTVLLWGDTAGMRALSDFLRKTLTTSSAMTLSEFCEHVDGKTISVRMRANLRDTVMRLNHEGLEWSLRPQSADDFAELVDVVGAPG
jgi:hypothetical protein